MVVPTKMKFLGKVVASVVAISSTLVQADICFMLYQMADNNLEPFIRSDNTELVQSTLLEDSTLTTWIYFDGRNVGGYSDDITNPLPFIYNMDGSEVTTKYDGSRYLHYDHGMAKMVVETTLPGEQDGDNNQTVYNFVSHAVTDCIAAGSTEYFLVFSSHGGGFAGFGGDENWQRRRLQLQPNQDIVGALRNVLNDVPGAPEKFDIIGFDACLMAAFGALDDYRNITNYFLAAEATEPGHGWAYAELTDASSALNLAEQIVDTFIDTPQNEWNFQFTPKTLSIASSEGYSDFLVAWEALSEELGNLLEAADDANFFAYLQRSRASAISFEGYTDDTGTPTPSALDIGSFIETFRNTCTPNSNTNLQTLLDAAETAYNDMFVLTRNGLGTPAATGMHIIWPVRTEFNNYPNFYTTRLFDTSNYYTTDQAPQWRRFLRLYYDTEAPTVDNDYVCGFSATSTIQQERPDQLLLNPEIEVTPEQFLITSDIMIDVDEVIVEYGIDFTSLILELFMGGGARRHNNRHRNLQRLNQQLIKKPPTAEAIRKDKKHPFYRKGRSSRTTPKQRNTQLVDVEGDYLLYYGGNIRATFEGSFFEAIWDRRFWGIVDAEEQFEEVYVYDDGNGARSIPVLYFPSSVEISDSALPLFSLQDGFDLGGLFSFLTFSVDLTTGEVMNNLILYTTNNSTGLSETPKSAGGKISPIINVEARLNGFHFEMLVGGVIGTVFDWSETSELSIHAGNIQFILEDYGLDNYVIDVVAHDYDNDVVDYFNFELDTDSQLVIPDEIPIDVGVDIPTLPGEATNGQASSNNQANQNAASNIDFSSASVTTTRFVLLLSLCYYAYALDVVVLP